MKRRLSKYSKGGKFLTVGGEYHRIYKNADGDIIVNHPKEDKGKWDTINLTDKANAKTVADGVAATKKWHRENPYGYGGSIFNYPDGGRTPIIVSNPNDPRLQAYNDSLNSLKFAELHNALYEQRIKDGKFNTFADMVDFSKSYVDSPEYKRLIQSGIESIPVEYDNGAVKFGYDADGKPVNLNQAKFPWKKAVFKTPVQPVIYQKSEKSEWSKYFGEPKPLTVKVGDGRMETALTKDYYYVHRPTGKKYSPEEYEKIKNKEEGGLINNTMKKRTLSKTVYKYGGKLPQHGTGATVGSAVGGATAMSLNLLVPGLGFAAAPVGTALGSMIGETFDDKGPSQEELQRQQETADRIKYGPKQENPYVDVTQKNFNFPYGGVIDEHMANPNAELELEETFQTPDGTVGRVDGPSHDNGGIEVNLPEGTKIFSDRLKYKNGRTYAQITKPITTKIAKLEKKLQDNPQDVASANTVYLLNQQLDHYFDDQETNKSMKEMKRTLKMANGGMIKRADGSYSRRGLWDNIRANKGSGKKPTAEMLKQEAKIRANEKAMGGYISEYEVGGITTQPKPKPKVINKRLIFGQGQSADTLNIPNNIKIGITPNDSALMVTKLGLTPNDVENLKEIQEDQLWNAINRNPNDSRFPRSEFGNWFKSQLNGDNRYRFQNRDYRIEQYSEGGTNNPGFRALPEEVQANILANMGMGGEMYSLGGRLMNDHMYAEGGKLPKEVLMPRLQAHMSPAEVEEYLDEYGSGGYTVRKTNERKGKTHVVIGPDGTKKYFGDPKMGEKGKSKYGKEAFYARHKKNLDKNPYFRAYARATWQEGGTIGEEGMNQEPLFEYKDGGIYIKPENRGKFTAYAKAHGKGVQEMASHIMANKEDYSPTLVKRANFAKNAAKWKHEHGGLIHYPNGGPVLGQINPRTGKAFSRDEVSTYYDFADMLPTPFGMEYGGLDSQGNQRFGNYNQLSLPSPVNPQETISPRLPQRPQPGALAAPSPVNAQLPYTSVAPDVTVPFTPENPVFGFTDRTDLFPKQPAQITMQPSTTPPVTAGQTLTPDKEVTFTTGTTSKTPTTPTTKPESWASRNMGTIGQVGAGLAGAALRAYNLSKVKAPEKLSSLDFSSSMYNPDLVDYSANINAANRSAISAMDEAQRGFGSSAAAQAFKNKARLNQLETTGKIYQGQENVNKQLLNEARQRNQQVRMQEQAANQDIARQNMENAYNYNVWKQQQKNQIIQDLMGTAGDVFGGIQQFKNQKEMANVLAKARENEVNIDALPEEVQLSYFRSLSPDQQATFNQKRARLGRTTFEFGGMIREFKDGGIHIKPENRGKFTATKKRTGKSTEELTHSKNPLTRKRAIFAQNAKKWAKK